MTLTLADFDYDLPQQLIATRPVVPRDQARLLVADGAIQDRRIGDLPQLLRAGDLLVFNDTKVIPARLLGHIRQKTIEVLLHRSVGAGLWEAFARGSKKLKIDDILSFGGDFTARVMRKDLELGTVYLQFTADEAAFWAQLQQFGTMPVPPYFERLGDDADKNDYQTLFANQPGAVAAPTASLHFTESLLQNLEQAGIDHATVTLHVGAGTFAPVRVDRIEDHIMHYEWADISAQTAEKIKETKRKGGRIVAIGTTVVRTLESAMKEKNAIAEWQGETNLFITPGYPFQIVDAMVTNFHLPKSTLLMLVSAFAGFDRIKKIYAHAIENQYRFYSYGDACLLFPQS